VLITAYKHLREGFCWHRTALPILGPAPAARAQAGIGCAEAASLSKQRGIARTRKKKRTKKVVLARSMGQTGIADQTPYLPVGFGEVF
jgi:hypothetical protein